MSVLLGLDTGGTYTDAVLFDPAQGVTGGATGDVIAAAKALTTKHDLAIGLREAIEAVLAEAPPDILADIALVSLSTTLATNAIVEGYGSPICLLLLGYDPKALDKAGLRQALGGDPVVFIEGGHTPAGDEQAPLDLEAARQAVLAHAPNVAAFAVSGFFSVRNAAHECAIRDLIQELTDRPVTCGHELTSKLDAPRRALTAALNARLIPQLQQLIRAIGGLLAEKGIAAPLMVVKGDGSLIEAKVALGSPVETILSGPAASLVGARHLSGEDDVFVVDMGGTTTDIALLRDGRPVLAAEGATVGGWRTMVEAVAVHTFGLGGDSEVRVDEANRLVLGPRRIVPLSLLGRDHGSVIDSLRQQLSERESERFDGRFALRLRPLDTGQTGLDRVQAKLWEDLAVGPVALSRLITGHASERGVARLVDRGLVAIGGFTPSDAAHVLELQQGWSAEAARLGGALWLRRVLDAERAAIPDVEAFARRVVEQVVRQSARVLLTTALAEADGINLGDGPVSNWLVDRGLGGSTGGGEADAAPLAVSLTLRRPLVAIGAPVATYYPDVAERLNTRLVIPDHAAVSNAVGAVAGGVMQAATAVITAPAEDRYRVHLPTGLRDFDDLEAAAAFAVAGTSALATEQAQRAGAVDLELRHDREDKVAEGASGFRIFIESRITATAFGRPRLARE
ncbi:hydantoinase/oxoprolinase family protein [Rhodospirillaceae bacterium SYSU D60014]|uniref:hydantoinase/oxoprolinase N-terminal domain-containing protein n=1 Tax=Virgifigura deserti TaxID=2268457 RepID=UPI000E670C3E